LVYLKRREPDFEVTSVQLIGLVMLLSGLTAGLNRFSVMRRMHPEFADFDPFDQAVATGVLRRQEPDEEDDEEEDEDDGKDDVDEEDQEDDDEGYSPMSDTRCSRMSRSSSLMTGVARSDFARIFSCSRSPFAFIG